METKKTTSILPGVIYTQLKDTYTFKEITETEELEKAFRLRYEVYSECQYSTVIKKNKFNLDVDIFDLHSQHYGLYTNCNELIGYLRVVLSRNKFYNSDVFRIGEKIGTFSANVHSFDNLKNQSIADYPFLSYSVIPKEINSYYNTLKEKGEEFAEASRLIIKKKYRGMRTSLFLIKCAMTLFNAICNNKINAVISCSNDHTPIYKRFGFQPFGDYHNRITLGTTDINCLHLSSIKESLRLKFQNMIEEYSKTSKISVAI